MSCTVLQTIRADVTFVDKLAPYRKEAFEAVAPDVPLPPEPILMRWGTGLCAESCCTEHLETVRNFLNTFDPKSAASIQIAQDVLTFQLSIHLSFCHSALYHLSY
jgi:hypothetical protein